LLIDAAIAATLRGMPPPRHARAAAIRQRQRRADFAAYRRAFFLLLSIRRALLPCRHAAPSCALLMLGRPRGLFTVVVCGRCGGAATRWVYAWRRASLVG